MNTNTMTYAELWRAHHADPHNITVAAEIHRMDNGVSDGQLHPSTMDSLFSPLKEAEIEDELKDAKLELKAAERTIESLESEIIDLEDVIAEMKRVK